MSNDDETVERVARAIYESDEGSGRLPWARLTELSRGIRRREARAALSAMPQRLSPELIAKLTALASRLTAQGEYEAVDLIDTVVARATAMPERELLREALEALQGLSDDVVEYVALNKLHDADGSPAINNHWMRRARAAADKIRAALEHQQKGGTP